MSIQNEIQTCHDRFCPSRRRCLRGKKAPTDRSEDFHRQGNVSCFAFLPVPIPNGRGGHSVAWDFMGGVPA